MPEPGGVRHAGGGDFTGESPTPAVAAPRVRNGPGVRGQHAWGGENKTDFGLIFAHPAQRAQGARRIPRESLIKFMKDSGIPLDQFETGKMKVVIVDDDPEIVELMVDVLARDGRFEIKTASSGYDAGIITEQFRPDLIILDYMLPDVNGNIVCQTIRKNPEFDKTKVIIVSGVVNESEIQDLLSAGAEDFIKKPFSISDLIQKIEGVLQMQ